MRYLLTLLLITNFYFMNAQESVHEFTITTISGETKSLVTFKGKKMLFVNTASQCGFTPQYTELQQVHEDYGDKLVIIGFPANNFGGQEPGANSEIKSFCQKNYGVDFLLSEKVSVKGNDISPLFKWLNSQANNSFKGDILWNFEKYLIDENGKLIQRFRSITKPNSEKIISLI
jgi:glutathione peroxidase